MAKRKADTEFSEFDKWELEQRDEAMRKGDAYYKKAKLVKACKEYQEVIDYSSDFYKAHHGKGLSLMGLKKFPEALVCFNKVIELKPRYSAAHGGRAVCLFKRGDSEGALASINRAIQLAPTEFHAYNTKGHILFKLERFDEALAMYYKSFELNPNYSNTQEKIKLCMENISQSISPQEEYRSSPEL